MYRVVIALFKDHKKKISVLFFLMLVASFLDMLSIGMLVPILNTFFNSSIDIPYISFFFEKLSLKYNRSELITISLMIIFLIFLLKNIFILIYTKINTNYLVFLSVKYQEIIYQKYIYSPISTLNKMTTPELLRNIQKEATLLSGSLISPALTLILNFITLIFFTILLLFVNFKITLITFIFLLIIFFIFSKIFKKKLELFGQYRQKFDKMTIAFIRHTFDGIRELKINSKENFFSNSLKKTLSRYASIGVTRSIITVLPRITMEVILVFLFTFGIYILITLDYEYEKIVLSLPIYAAAAFRMLPNLNSMIRSYQKMTYTKNAFTTLEHMISNKENNNKKKEKLNDQNLKLSFKNKIEIKNISFSYGEKVIFKNLNIEIMKNKVIGIKGDSGCGKSTLVDLLCGLNKPNIGEILIDGINLLNNEISWRKNIGYVQQNFYIFNETLKKNITFEDNDDKIDYKLLNASIDNSLLNNLVKTLPEGINEKLGEFGSNLSGGQKQRICISRALYKNPSLLIFDESFNNIEENKMEKILEIISSLKNRMTIVIISHNEKSFKNCDEIYKIENYNIKKIN